VSLPRLLVPRDRAELAQALRGATPDSRMVAGGTDLMLELRASARRPDLLIDLSRLRELSFIRREEGGRIRIGALTTFAAMQRDAVLAGGAACLAQAAGRVGSPQIRNVATLGGNVAHASACADAIPALLALAADAGVMDADGSVRRQPVQDVVSMTGGTRLRPDQAILDFSFAALHERQPSAFGKVGVRTSVAVARLNAAIVLTLEQGGDRIVDARVAFGSIAPTALLGASVAASLPGRSLRDDAGAELAEACAALVAAAIPARGSLPYKQTAVRGLALDLWAALQGAPGPGDRIPSRPG